MMLAEVASLVEGTLTGPGDLPIEGIKGLDEASPTDLSFIDDAKLAERARHSRAAAILVPAGLLLDDKPTVAVRKPKLAWAQLLGKFYPSRTPAQGIHPTAVVGSRVTLAEGANIGPYCVVGDDVSLGPRASLVSHVRVGDRTQLAADVAIFPHASIGSDCRFDEGVRVHAWTSIGPDVHLDMLVEIGARCSLGSGSVVGEGSKIDNMVTMGSGISIGRHTILVSYSDYSDRASIGSYCLLAGQVWIQEGVSVGDKCIVAGRARVTANLPARSFISGDLNRPHKEELRLLAYIERLPDALRRCGALDITSPTP